MSFFLRDRRPANVRTIGQEAGGEEQLGDVPARASGSHNTCFQCDTVILSLIMAKSFLMPSEGYMAESRSSAV